MLSIKEINRKIAGVKKSTTTIRDNVQVILCSIAGHAYEHGRVTMYQSLYAATTGLNKKNMVKWIHENGFARLQKDGTFKLNKKMRNETQFDDGEAVVAFLTTEAKKWYENEDSAEQILKALDVTGRITALTKAIDKAIENGQEVKTEDFKVALRKLEEKVLPTAA